MRPIQSDSRFRGVGRFSHHLVDALLAADPGVSYVLYRHDGLPDDLIPSTPRAEVRDLHPEPAGGGATAREGLDRIAWQNPDRLDALLLLNPFEFCMDYEVPARPLRGPMMVSVLHDLIPFLSQEHYLRAPETSASYYRRVTRLRHYDLLLANSEATRSDALELLGMAPERVTTIMAASDDRFFGPDPAEPMPLSVLCSLRRLGITRPFVLNVGSQDERKNLHRLIDAFGLLPRALRRSHQLVITCSFDGPYAASLRARAAERQVGDSLVLTGEVPDETLRLLYQRCAAFAFPSLYEGFGLPILEAMLCGAAVVAGNNSSQPEVVGDAGLLANAADPGDIAEKLRRLLADGPLRADLRARAPEQAARFSWARSAERALESLRRLAARPAAAPRRRRVRAHDGHRARPRLAFFSPFPPKASGISDYAVRLLEDLDRHYAVDLYHDAGYIPHLGLGSSRFACHDYRLFDRHAAERGFDAVLYQMGNSTYHYFIYETLMRHPGVVTLHDFNLSNFHYAYSHDRGRGMEDYRRELAHHCPDRAAEVLPKLDEWDRQPFGVQVACAREGLYLNRRVFERSLGVVVHSPWCREQVRRLFPEHAEKTHVVPFGATLLPPSPGRRAEIRARFDLPADAIILASFGMIAASKLNVETVEAYAALAGEVPEALLLFVGEDHDGGAARRRVAELGLSARVRFAGRQSIADFVELAGAVDVGINLRMPPTNGETSAALMDLLRSGVPTIVTDVATFADYPDTAVRKVRWDADGPAELLRALRELTCDAPRRAALARSALDHVRAHHLWPHAAARYAEVLAGAFGPGRPTARGPHAPARPARMALRN